MQNTPNFDQDNYKLLHNELCDILKASFDQDEEEVLTSLKKKIEPLSEDELARIINMEDQRSTTLLHYAVYKQKINVIEYLLNKGAKSDIKNSICTSTAYDVAINFARTDDVRNLMDGNTPIHKYAIKGNIEGIERILVESASNSNFSIIDAKNRKGNTPLHLSVINQRTETLTFLLDKVAKIDQENNEGNTPLQLACKKGYLQIVKHLIAKGADSTVIDREGNNLLHLLSRSGISDTKFFYSLLEKGVNPNLRNKLGDTPLHHLLKGDEPEHPAIISLISIGANINAIDRYGETPLLISLKKPQNKFYRTLLQVGANPNFFSSNLTNQTPLERLFINLTSYYRNSPIPTQTYSEAIYGFSCFMRFGLKLTPEIKEEIKSTDDYSIARDIKTFMDSRQTIQFNYGQCLSLNPNIINETKKSIFRGNVVLDRRLPLTISKVTSSGSFDKDMIGEVFVESIKSISKEEWDSIKANPIRLKILQDSGFATLIELSRIPDKDGEKFVDNDIAIKTAINRPGDFIAFYNELKKIMSTNKSIINNLLKPKDSKDSGMIIDFNPTENSSKFDATQILSIEPLLLALLSPEFKKELDVQDEISNSKLQPEEARQDSKIKLIMSLAQIINSKLKKDLSPHGPDGFLSFINAIAVLAGDPRLGKQPSGTLTSLASSALGVAPSSALGGPASRALGVAPSSALGGAPSSALGGSASSKRPIDPAQNPDTEDKRQRGSSPPRGSSR